MNAGVSTNPFGVVKRPSRAEPDVWEERKAKAGFGGVGGGVGLIATNVAAGTHRDAQWAAVTLTWLECRTAAIASANCCAENGLER